MNALWQSVLGEIELSVSHATFTTWYKHTELVSQDDEELVISVPNIFAKKQFEVKFNDQIKQVLAKNGVEPKRIMGKKRVRTVKRLLIVPITPITSFLRLQLHPRCLSDALPASL
jgi:chromosomal replication initiation ATPase DnaA